VGFGQRIKKALMVDPDPQIRDGVAGDAVVIDADAYGSIEHGRVVTTGGGGFGHWLGEVRVVVRLPGEQPYQARVPHWMTRERYPVPGEVVPVTVERGDHSKVLLAWDALAEIDELVASGAPLLTDPDSVQRTVAEAVTASERGKIEEGLDLQVQMLEQLGQGAQADAVRQALGAAAAPHMPSADIAPRPPAPADRPTARIVSIMGDGTDTQVGSRVRTEFLLSVNVPGQPRYGVRWKGFEHTHRAYELWSDIPVEVDPGHADRIDILWDEMGAAASAVADRLQAASGEMQAKLARVTEMQQQAMAAYAGAGVPLDQIERLAKLHDAGALTDEEFAAEKARILGGS
jgi:hypothetical protein